MSYWSRNDSLRWGRYWWGPLLIGDGVVGRCSRVAEWPASVGGDFRISGIDFPISENQFLISENHFPMSGNWLFPDIGNWFPDIGNLNSRYREMIPDIRKCWIKTQMAFHSDSVYSGSEHRQFNSPMLVKREAGFPNPRRALIGSNQLWHVNDSPYYRELLQTTDQQCHFRYNTNVKYSQSRRDVTCSNPTYCSGVSSQLFPLYHV